MVVTRLRAQDPAFAVDLDRAVSLLAAMPGYLSGDIGRNLDEPDLWVLVTRWRDVGSYRRAMSAYEVKLNVVPLLNHAVDEPSAYEQVSPGSELNVDHPRQTGRPGPG